MLLAIHIIMLLVLDHTASQSTTFAGFRLLSKSTSANCTDPKSAAVSSQMVSVSRASKKLISCAQLCATVRSRCFAFYLTNRWFDCGLVTFGTMMNTWMSSALCPAAVYALPMPEETKINLTNCQQSSELWGGACTRDFDGVTNQNFLAGYCSHTSETTNQWWETDLSPGYFITKVQIFNRQDCCPERLNELTISVDGVACVNFATSVPFSISNFTCGRFGSVVRIQTPLSHGLAMCEVYIFGMKAA